MSKYIDVEPIIEYAKEMECAVFAYPQVSRREDEQKEREKWGFVRKILEGVAAADVAEVKHGRWVDGKRIGLDGTFYWFRQCSECLYEREDDSEDKDTPYCPNCGSRMDLDGEE